MSQHWRSLTVLCSAWLHTFQPCQVQDMLRCSSCDVAFFTVMFLQFFTLGDYTFLIMLPLSSFNNLQLELIHFSVDPLHPQWPDVTFSFVQPWLTLTGLDLQCLGATAPNLVDKFRHHVLTCHSFHDGVGPWTQRFCTLWVSEHAAPSVSTSVGNEPVWTLHDGKNDESDSIHNANQLGQSPVSTSSSIVTSTNLAISCTFPSSHSTLLANFGMSTNTTVLSRHTFSSFVSASSIWDSSINLTKRPWVSWSHPHLWVWSQPSLARGQGPLTFPRTIRQSAFTQKLDIEGCDPLSLPLAALLYQQANNFWLRKLAHGREVYMIPTGDIAAVVFMTELLTQLRNKGVDLDTVSHCRARQDGKLLGKTSNTKYAAQQIADIIHSWVPTRTTDPDTQHELTQLRSQLAQLRQTVGEDNGVTSTPPTTGPSASSPVTTPIQRALLNNSNNPSPPPPPGFDPSSLLVCPTTVNPWLA